MRAQESTILEFIGGLKKVFIIPPFQRNYEWKTEQCEELFEDIEKACRNNKSHYLGNIVYYVGRNSGAAYSENILIDGQQRVTTILILLCAIRDAMDPVTNKEDINDINKMYLRNEGAQEDYRVRLKQTDYDEGCYTRLVDGNFTDTDTGKIATNYRRFVELIKESDISPKDLYETIPRLEVVGVNLQIDSDLEAVQTIFEKINSTGKPLTAADLLRNYLLICDNSKEQERLYKSYWVKIEETISTEHIAAFVRHYLLMKVTSWVEKDDVYKNFKIYMEENNLSHEQVLKDMKDYSIFYETLIKENSASPKLNRHIQFIKHLGADDLFCFMMYLLKACKDKNEDSEKVFNLLRCFQIRYRIVKPASGGGAIQSLIQRLMQKFSSNEIEFSYDSLYFELSNSPNESSRYPNDDDFKKALMTSVKRNHTYGRAVLLGIEEFETKNIPVKIDEVTIEHLMPQTPTDWWTNNFGGAESAEAIYREYLNCIGNLAPLSGPYNSENSNKPWTDKVKIIKNVQFKTTQEAIKNANWKKAEIELRNEDIASRACKAIMGPLERTRPYSNQKTFEEFVPGVYPITDLDTDMNYTDIKSVSIEGNEIQLSNWNQLLVKLGDYLNKKDAKIFTKVVESNLLHKDKKSKNPPNYDPIFSSDKTLVNTAKKIEGTTYYVEGNISGTRARVFAVELLKLYNLEGSCSITVDKKVD